MDSLPSSTDLSTKVSGSMTGLLSSFNGVLDNHSSGETDTFANFLISHGAKSATGQNSAKASANSTQTTASVNTNSKTSLNLIKHITVEIHHIIQQLNKQKSDKDSSGSSQSETDDSNHQTNAGNNSTADVNAQAQTQTDTADCNADATDSSSVDNSAANPGQISLGGFLTGGSVNTNATTLIAGTDTTGSSQDATVSTTSQPLTAVLSQLEIMLQAMLKDLQAAQLSAGNTVTASSATQAADASSSSSATGNTAQTSDTSGASQSGPTDPLTQLLAFLQMLNQQLAGSSDASPANISSAANGTAAASASTSLTSGFPAGLAQTPQSMFAQIQKSLKELTVALSNLNADQAASTSDSASTDTTTPASASAPSSLSLSNSAPVHDLSNIFGNSDKDIFGNNTTNNNFAPIDAHATPFLTGADGKAGVSADANTQNGDGSSSGNSGADTSSLNANNNILVPLADGAKAADPYSFASQLSATRAANGGMTGLPGAVDQVILQMNRSVKDGDSQMTIQLHPADLGKINVKLDIDSNGKVQGTVVANSPATLDLLVKDAKSLERALQDAGLHTDPGSLQFSLGNQGQSSGQTANGNNSGTSSGSNISDSASASTSLEVLSDSTETYYVTPGRVNLKV